jgi:4-amino-4-deoxy-L-arabinose transferase-like glycosyltransferase
LQWEKHLSNQTELHTKRALNWPLLAILLLGLLLRLALWDRVPRLGLISDEGEYLSAASWLIHGHGFNWYHHYLWTRAPLYPLFVGLHLWLFGEQTWPIMLSQIGISLLNVVLTYRLAQLVSPKPKVAYLAALLMAIYFPFALYPHILLSETLFIAWLLSAFLALGWWLTTRTRIGWRSYLPLALAGVLLGLSTLTRSITLMFLPVIALWIMAMPLSAQQPLFAGIWRRMWRQVLPAVVLMAFALGTVAPWTLFNSRIFGGLVLVDTTGAFNLLLGGRTAYDGNRNDAATRDYVLALLGQKAPSAMTSAPCGAMPEALPTQAARQGAMNREGVCLIFSKPIAFASKSLVELVDLFQINYTGAERFSTGFTTGRLPIWYTLGLFLLDDTLYIIALPLGILGWAIARRSTLRGERANGLQVLIGLWCAYNVAIAPLLFAINRFRLPLLPIVFIFAAIAVFGAREQLAALLRSWAGRAWTVLAIALFVIASTPYAYFWPNSQSMPSYFGPYPSSLANTLISLRERSNYVRMEQAQAALAAKDSAEALALLDQGPLTMARVNQKAADVNTLVRALALAQQGQAQQALDLLPDVAQIMSSKDVETTVVRGDILRSLGRADEAKAMFGRADGQYPTVYVDDANPVDWAWAWLQPAPLPNQHLDLAGDLDLGYISNCYLGEGDSEGTFRWCRDGTQLRFPQAGKSEPQTLVLRADGRGWPNGWTPVPPVQVFLGEQLVGEFVPSLDGVQEFSVPVPAGQAGADLVFTLRTPMFVGDATRFMSQQGVLVGQTQYLGVRLDWVELR